MQRFHSFGDAYSSQNQQYQYYSTQKPSQNAYQYPQRGYDYSFQKPQQQSQYERRQTPLFDPNLKYDEVLETQSMKVGRDKSNSPIRQIYEATQPPLIQQMPYSNLYPVTYQTNMAQNQRYQDYSPNTRQNTIVEADSLENTIKKQQGGGEFYSNQLQMMNAQQQQLQYLNQSPFQSVAITPQKNISNRQSSTIQSKQQQILYENQEAKTIRYASPQTNRALFTTTNSTLNDDEKRSNVSGQQIHLQETVKNNRQENKDMYDSIQKNVDQIVSKYFKPISKQRTQYNETLETQSMHQLSNHKSIYDQNQLQNRTNTQGNDRNWSPLFSSKGKQNSSSSSIYSQPFDIQTQQDIQKTVAKNINQLSPSYSKYISPETERILQKWNNVTVGQPINQINTLNKYAVQQYENNKQQRILEVQQYQQQPQQLLFPSNTQVKQGYETYLSFNPDRNQLQNLSPQSFRSNSQYSLSGLNNYHLDTQVIPKNDQELQQAQNSSYNVLNQGFIQSNQQTFQAIPNQNSINNLSSIEKQTRNELNESEQNKILQAAKLNSIDDFGSFEKDENMQDQNENNFIYDSHEMFDVKNLKNRNVRNNLNDDSEVFHSLKNNSTNQVLTPSCSQIPQHEISHRKVSSGSTDSNHEFSLKQILNIPKTIKKIHTHKESEVNKYSFLMQLINIQSFLTFKKKKQKSKSLLIYQVVCCILILIFLYVLLIK